MPVVVYALPIEHFIIWWEIELHTTFSKKVLVNADRYQNFLKNNQIIRSQERLGIKFFPKLDKTLYYNVNFDLYKYSKPHCAKSIERMAKDPFLLKANIKYT